MSDSPFLPSAPRAHRLPPRWDGSTVEWGEWQADDSTLRFHVRPEPCPYCGGIAPYSKTPPKRGKNVMVALVSLAVIAAVALTAYLFMR